MILPKKILYRKQFVISDHKLESFEDFNHLSIAGLNVYGHKELSMQMARTTHWQVLLIGDLYDYQRPIAQNQEIVEAAIEEVISLDDLLKAFDPFCGSFLVLAEQLSTNQTTVFTDMAASREFFYTLKEDGFFAASQPVMIDKVTDVSKQTDPEVLAFFDSKSFQKKQTLITNMTEFQNVFRLKPNHCLDLKTGELRRFAPINIVKGGDMKPVAKQAAAMLRGFVHAVSSRGKLAIPVSAGWESRVLLAASKEISNDVSYFVYQHADYSDRHQDVAIPRKLLKKLGLKLNIITYDTHLDADLKEGISQSLSFPRFRNFNFLVNGLHKQLPGYGILNGNISEVARLQFDEVKLNGGEEVAVLEFYAGQPYAVKEYKKWYDQNSILMEERGFRLTDLLYWEENSANWVGKTNTETRLVAEILQPFNCRDLIMTMYGVDERYRLRQTAKLYRQIVKELWPECLLEPVNPAPKKVLIRIMQIFGIYGSYRNLLMRYQLAKIAKHTKR